MSKSRIVDKRTDRIFPKQSKVIGKKSKKSPKFFGWTSGDNGKISNDTSVKIKGKDYVKYGYPLDCRSKAELKRSIQDRLTLEELRDADVYHSNMEQ